MIAPAVPFPPTPHEALTLGICSCGMSKGTIAILVGPEYEDLGVWYPKLRLEEAGFETPLVGMREAH